MGITDGLSESLSTVNVPAVVVLAATGVPAAWYIVRQMVHYQREFAEVYIEENRKLRVSAENMETLIRQLRSEALEHQREMLKLEAAVAAHELTIEEHRRTIAELSRRARDQIDPDERNV